MRLRAVVGWLALCVLAPLARAQDPNFVQITTADQPSYLADPGDGRLFLTELAGRVRIFSGGQLQDANDAFLDIHTLVNTSGEGGMHSLAFDPSFSSNHWVYVEYTRTGSSGSPLETVIARYTVMDGDPNHADPASGHIVLTQESPSGAEFTNHKGGQLQFGPDGFLYFAFGDGGSANDPGCRSQTHDVLFGKMLRIDPHGDDFPGDPNQNYAIPGTNPFAVSNDPNHPFRTEIYALGLRNPYRFSFDQQNGDLWIGDVGQDNFEEVDMEPPLSGGGGGRNYGWKPREGAHCRSTGAPNLNGCAAYVAACDDPGYVDPINEYDHTVGQTIIGGFVYRGSVSAWQGRYIFGDYSASLVFSLASTGAGFVRTVIPSPGVSNPISFGQDHAGNLYVLSINGPVFRIDFPDTVPPTPISLSKGQKSCVAKLNDGFTNVTDAESSLIRSCFDRFATGKLTTDFFACYVPNEKIAKLEGKNDDVDVKQCQSSPPPLGYNGTNAGNERATAVDEQVLIGGPLAFSQDAIILKSIDKTGAACQKSVLKAAAACSQAQREEFVRCKKAGLKADSFASSADLAACLGQDLKQRVFKVCDSSGKLGSAITKSCVNKGVNLTTAFPGCAAADAVGLSSCIDLSATCQTCLLFKDADALDVDCTACGE